MFLSWAICGTYLAVGLWGRLRFLSVFLAPGLLVTGLLALQPRLDAPGPDFDLERWALSLHVVFILLGYAAFGLAALAAAVLLVREPSEREVAERSPARRLPSPADLEQALVRSLAAGLVLLTAGLAISFGLMRERYGVAIRPDPKIAWSALVWAVYLGLVVARLRFGRPARAFAWGALGGFVFVLLTFWGTNLLSPIHHP